MEWITSTACELKNSLIQLWFSCWESKHPCLVSLLRLILNDSQTPYETEQCESLYASCKVRAPPQQQQVPEVIKEFKHRE